VAAQQHALLPGAMPSRKLGVDLMPRTPRDWGKPRTPRTPREVELKLTRDDQAATARAAAEPAAAPAPEGMEREAGTRFPKVKDKRSCICCLEMVNGDQSLDDKEPAHLCGCCNLYFIDTRTFQLPDGTGRVAIGGPCTKVVVVHNGSQKVSDQRTGFCTGVELCSTVKKFDRRFVKSPPLADAPSTIVIEDGECALNGCDFCGCVAGKCWFNSVSVAMEPKRKVEPCCCIAYAPFWLLLMC